jgi:hypothetical protein
LASEIFREPSSTKFKSRNSDSTFYVVNFHSSTYDDNPRLEIKYFKYYQEQINIDKLLIAGDFDFNEKQDFRYDPYQQGFKSAVRDKKLL